MKRVVKIIIILLQIQRTICLRDVELIVPEAAEKGSKVEMKCLYNLEQQELYSVKWYRGEREFCRYIPREVPPLRVFKIPGIEVDRDQSNATRIVIKAATEVAQGQYTCEVSADAPFFSTALVHAHMYVVVLPKEGPSINGLMLRYRPGMKLKAECISANSLPAANISFFVNNEPALSQHVLHRVDGSTAGGLWSAYSTIQFTVQKHHFISKKMRIGCAAHIYRAYWKSVEKCLLQERIKDDLITSPKINITRTRHVNRVRKTDSSTHQAPTGIGTKPTLSLLLILLSLLGNF